MIEKSPYLPSQMNGPVINSVMQGLDGQLKDADTIIDYLHDLTLDNAQETELESIGCIIGYPRPLVPVGFAEENILILTSLPLYQDESIGLATLNSELGGRLGTTELSDSNYMALGLYRALLKKVAYIKRYGITLYSIDQILKTIDTDYTISWNEDADIEVYFENEIGFKNIWLLTQLFYRIATVPQVIITSA